MNVLEVATTGPVLASEADALDLVASTYGLDVDLLAIPVVRLDPAFFDLSSGLAGAFVQKLLNYRLRVAFVGATPERGAALRDWIVEANRGGHVWFVADRAALDRRLNPPPG